MSEKSKEGLIREYIKDIKKALPDWLKEKKEHKEILIDLEEHLWQKAKELSNAQEPTIESVQMAIEHMGPPKNIAKEYKRRGTPKVYITQEMWPLYLRVLTIVFAIVIIINIISFIFEIINSTVELGETFLSLVSGIQNGIFISFAIITIIFVVLSMEGYFPEDFKSKKQLKKEKLRVEEGLPAKPFIKPAGEIIGGSIGLIVGILFLFQPFPTYMFIADFLLLIRFFGILMIVGGSLDITRGVIGNRRPSTHQIIFVIKLSLKFGVIPLLIVLLNRPDIFPWFSEPWIHVGIPAEFLDAYRIGMTVLIVIVALTSIDEIYRITKLQKYK